MARAISPADLVALPRGLDSSSLHTLAQALIVPAKKAKGLSKGTEAALEDLEKADEALTKASGAQLALPQGTDVRAADHVEDQVWSALFDVLTGWSRLPAEQPQGAIAQKLLSELFPDRLSFTQLPFKTEWSEVDKRITRIKKGGLGKQLAGLGLQPFLDAIDDAHATYSAALGITTTPADNTVPSLRKPFDETATAIRGYVVQLVAEVSAAPAAKKKTFEALLAPFTTWESPSARGKKGSKAAAPSSTKSGS